jgi:GH24 family phage-related lysozyme (muramidase)
MTVSNKCIELIKAFEGCKLVTYLCPAGVPSIGFGHTGKDVKAGMKITQEKAEELLRNDLINFENNVQKYNKRYNWTQYEYDAMVCFAYNVGSINQLTALGTRSKSTIAKKILFYNRSNGKVLSGLTLRRQFEQNLFLNK